MRIELGSGIAEMVRPVYPPREAPLSTENPAEKMARPAMSERASEFYDATLYDQARTFFEREN